MHHACAVDADKLSDLGAVGRKGGVVVGELISLHFHLLAGPPLMALEKTGLLDSMDDIGHTFR